jgi:molybdenum-dependent DNA-binding transcriptional regulator ModE
LKNSEEVMEILEAFDLTGTLRGAAELAGCDHKTVAHWVRAREEAGGGLPVRANKGAAGTGPPDSYSDRTFPG